MEKVLINHVPEGITREKLFIHFQQTKNGGGDVDSLVFPITGSQSNSAVIKYHDESTAQSVLKRQHEVTRRKINVQVEKFKCEIFEKVTVEGNKSVIDKIPNVETLHDDLLEETGVIYNKQNASFEGEWYQIRTLADRLQRLQTVDSDDKVDTTALTSDEDKNTPDVTPDKSEDGIEIILDKDIYEYMHLIESASVDNIISQHRVEIKVVDDAVSAKFKGKKAEDGIGAMQKLYNNTMDNSVQITSDISTDISKIELQKFISHVQKLHRSMIISYMASCHKVLFIGSSKKDCQEAVDTFESFMRSRMPSSYAWKRPLSDNSRNLYEYKYPDTGLEIQVIKGDIAAQHADAIVNAANSELRGGSGVTGAIFRAGGYSFESACKDFMQKRNNKKLQVGEVVHTSSCGSLRCNWVIHVTGPKWHTFAVQNREDDCRKSMEDICNKLINYASQTLQCRSISIPAISTGIFGVPLQLFCEAMLDAIHQHQKNIKRHPTATLKKICLVNFDRWEAESIAEKFRRVLDRQQESAV